MIVIPNDTLPEWSSEDAAILRSFLESSTGKKALEIIAAASPSLLDGADVNATLVRSGKLDGFMSAVSSLLSLTTSRPAEATGAPENYPSLDDDSQWPNDLRTPTN